MKVRLHLLTKTPTWEEDNSTGLSRNKRGEPDLSKTHPVKDGSAGKRRKQYVDHLKIAPKHCMIHALINSSDECKVLG